VKTAARDGNFRNSREFVMGNAVLQIKTMISSLISAADHSERDLNF
jgi:hypothetical protein